MDTKYLSINWQQYHEFAQKIAGEILKDKIPLDEIVAIARGGLTLGLILSDFLRIPISAITIQSYTDIQKHGVLQITAKLGKRIYHKHILLVDDIAEYGRTFRRAVNYLQRFKPASIITAALIYKPHSQFQPDYFGKQTKLWTLQPHEVTEWITTFSAKMKKEGKSEKEVNKFLLAQGYTQKQISFIQKHYL